jgi:hypothetical protein
MTLMNHDVSEPKELKQLEPLGQLRPINYYHEGDTVPYWSHLPYISRYTQAVPVQQSLLELLQGGGYVLYARHAEANVGADQPNLSLQDCTAQRNLSDFGRSQAATYGEVIRRARIPVMYPVVASPFCRTRETADWAFGGDYVQIDPFLIDIYRLNGNLSPTEQRRILNNLQSYLEMEPTPGNNKVVIAHSFPSGVGLNSIPNMGTVVIRPRGQGNGYEVVGHLTLEDMVNLGE